MLNCKPSRSQYEYRKLKKKMASYRLNSQENDAPVCSERKDEDTLVLRGNTMNCLAEFEIDGQLRF